MCVSYLYHTSTACVSYLYHTSTACVSYLYHTSIACVSYLYHTYIYGVTSLSLSPKHSHVSTEMRVKKINKILFVAMATAITTAMVVDGSRQLPEAFPRRIPLKSDSNTTIPRQPHTSPTTVHCHVERTPQQIHAECDPEIRIFIKSSFL